MTQPRTCTQCGTVYAFDNQDAVCTMLLTDGGGVAICGGDIQPPPTIPGRAVNCLVCLDTGRVHSGYTDESWRCPRGCANLKSQEPA